MNNIEITALINDYVMPWGIKIALSIIIFYVGRMVVSLVVGSVGKLLAGRGMDEILIGFLTSIMRWVLLLFVIVAALSQLGVDTTSLVALRDWPLVYHCNHPCQTSPPGLCLSSFDLLPKVILSRSLVHRGL